MENLSVQKVDDGVVFLTDNPEYAEEYGDVVFEIGDVDAKYFGESPYGDSKEYCCTASDLNENGWWRRAK